MGHKLYTSRQAATAVLAALRYLSVLPRTVRLDFSKEFVPGRGSTIDVKKPITAGQARIYTAANRAARDSIEFNELSQDFVSIKLENQLYNAVRLPDDWSTFDLAALGSQVLRPQAESVVDALATPLITEMHKIKANKANSVVVKANGDSNVLNILTKMRSQLNARKVPMAGRYLAVGVEWEEILLNTPQLQKANEHGDGGSMLKEATIGRLFGFDIIVAPELDAFASAFFDRLR